MVVSLLRYFDLERENSGPLLSLNAAKNRVAAALNTSLSSVNNIAAKQNKQELPDSPKVKISRVKPVVDIDDFDQSAIRNAIYDMYKKKDHITLESLRQTLVDRELFNGCKTSLWEIIKTIGVQYKKGDPRRGLMDLPHIALKHIEFLRKYMQVKRKHLLQLVFLDETWIFQDGRSWQDEIVQNVKKNNVGRARFIVIHTLILYMNCDTSQQPR